MMPATQISKDVEAWLHAREDAMTGFITDLARIESPSSDPEALVEILTWLQQQFTALGLYTIRVPGKTSGGYLYARPMPEIAAVAFAADWGNCTTMQLRRLG